MKFTSMLVVAFTTLGICPAQISTEAGTTGGLSGQLHDERGAHAAVNGPGPAQTASPFQALMLAQIKL